MANLGEQQKAEETEYEGESDESLSKLATRRKNASDDDDDKGKSEGETKERFVRSNQRFRVGYGDESNGLGGYDEGDAVSYEDEHEDLENELPQLFNEEEEDDDFEENEREDRSCEKEISEGVKHRKEKESVAPVDPKNGAFYMHDDRFSGRGPSRRTLDERFRALTEEQMWKHDKFEEMKAWETYDIRKISKQYHQGHCKDQGKGQGYMKANWYKTHDNTNNQNGSSKVVRGRGPIKYNPTMRSNNLNPPTKNEQSKKLQGQASNTSSRKIFSTKNEQYSKPLVLPSSTESERIFSTKKSWKFMEKTSTSDSVRVPSRMSNLNSDSLAFEKHIFAANMNSASQMFNSSSLPKHDNLVTQKKEVQPGKAFGYFPISPLPNHNIYVPHCNSLLQGNVRANPIGLDKLYSGKLIHPASEDYLINLPLQSSISWPTYTVASPQMMGQRDLPFSAMLTHQLGPTCNQVSSVYPLVQQPIVQQIPVESMIQHPSQIFTQQLSQSSGSGAHTSSEALIQNSYVPGTLGFLPRLNKSEVASGGKGINTLHGSGRISLLSAETQSDQSFTATAALFPAMLQGSQKNGDPTVNTAVSEYISQSQNGFSNPEITWLPAFPAAAGTVGSACYSRHIIADGGYTTANSTGELSSYDTVLLSQSPSLLSVATHRAIIQDTLCETEVRYVDFTAEELSIRRPF